MAENVSDGLTYWMEMDGGNKELLAHVRHWENLKVASEGGKLWVKDFTDRQLQDPHLLSIPFTRFYYVHQNRLFPKGSLLPAQKLPALLWTPIAKALPVTLDGFNHNFFGTHEQLLVRLRAVEAEQPASAMLVQVKEVNDYITKAPAIRLKQLSWLLVNDAQALILGAPLLPINGVSYWQRGRFVLPGGYDLEFPILEKAIARQMDPASHHLIWWLNEQSYSLIQPEQLQALTIASWRQSVIL